MAVHDSILIFVALSTTFRQLLSDKYRHFVQVVLPELPPLPEHLHPASVIAAVAASTLSWPQAVLRVWKLAKADTAQQRRDGTLSEEKLAQLERQRQANAKQLEEHNVVVA